MLQRAIDSPIGRICIVCHEGAIESLLIGRAAEEARNGKAGLLDEVEAQLCEYFAVKRAVFDLPLAPMKTERGAALRAAICSIRPGSVRSYGEIARASGSSARAIGQACARKPLPLLVPCHRVVASGARIGNYSAGAGIETKRWLLGHKAQAVERGAMAYPAIDEPPRGRDHGEIGSLFA